MRGAGVLDQRSNDLAELILAPLDARQRDDSSPR